MSSLMDELRLTLEEIREAKREGWERYQADSKRPTQAFISDIRQHEEEAIADKALRKVLNHPSIRAEVVTHGNGSYGLRTWVPASKLLER